MTVTRRIATGFAALAGAALLLTGCGHGSTATAGPPSSSSSSGSTDDAKLKDMQQKVDSAESAAAQADSDATRNN
ncbi:hypothetical protein [Kitasatospora sp. MAP5-34]|uniref:hypothetical protein n=1 Tax=Kitasatospora sp. MAP5-34 TaxID=3035102 RepID=UPI0024742BA6|nr:hypothetical protein [Kitasatospora sp. MAP5-34]MDH6575333.1 outer membrane murein-binding lipoprotein Lpp [Kitasatospora sp. MAP5-34]